MSVPYWSDGDVTLHLGDCLDVLRTMEADSIDAIVTDPPAGIAFMDREWDDFRRARNPADAGRDSVFGRTSAHGPEYGRRDRAQFVQMLTERLAEAYRVLKPGGHALVWSIPRTSHWTAWAIEDAGFDIRDCIPHLFGSGFPKSRSVSKDIDKMAGADREVISEGKPVKRMIPGADQNRTGSWIKDNGREFVPTVTASATEDAARWEGWGTALKPGQETWWLARKPLNETVAANVLEYGTGAINVDGCRVGSDVPPPSVPQWQSAGSNNNWAADGRNGAMYQPHDAGRWPTNILLTHSAACEMTGTRRIKAITGTAAGKMAGQSTDIYGQFGGSERAHERTGYADADGLETVEAWDCAPDCPVAELDRQSGVLTSGANPERRRSDKFRDAYGEFAGQESCAPHRGADSGGASRFYPTFRYQAKAPASERPRLDDGTAHETVKSLGLMSWLVRLITPPGGTVLDLFAGSGPTAEACIIEGFRCVLIEKDPRSAELIKTRLSKPIQPTLFGLEAS